MDYSNYAENGISNTNDPLVTKFNQEVRKASLALYESIADTYASNPLREVKILLQSDNVYVLGKTNKSFNVFIHEIPSYIDNPTLADIFKYVEFDDEKIHLRTVYGFKTQNPISNNELLKLIADSPEEKKSWETIISQRQSLGDTSEYSLFNLSQKIKTSAMPHELRDYVELLQGKGFIGETPNEDFYRSLMKSGNSVQDSKIPDYQSKIKFFLDICSKNEFSLENPFIYNDNDNYILVDKKHLIVKDQTCGFYFDIVDENNYTVYFLDIEYKDLDGEITKISKGLKNNNLDLLMDTVWEVKNGKTQFFNTVFMYVMDLNFKCGVEAMQEFGEVTYPVDITSYQYQKDYYYTTYGYNELEFLAQAFLTLGGGFDYNKQQGNFVNSRVKYIPSLETETEPEAFTQMNHCNPTKFSYLNQDWKNGLKYLVENLEKDRPKPICFEGDDPDEAIDKAIKYFKLKLNKLEQSSKLKP